VTKHAKRADAERDPLVDINVEAARLRVQVRHIRRLVHERRIPYVKSGHLLRFDPAEVEAWLEAARVVQRDRTWRGEQGQRCRTVRTRAGGSATN
jgi:excisionase family DNA binding protein